MSTGELRDRRQDVEDESDKSTAPGSLLDHVKGMAHATPENDIKEEPEDE